MHRALELGANHHPHPNPRVGAVIADVDGEIAGQGAHTGTGADHAEVVALRHAGTAAQGGTLYVTLEPCTHQGRTPPCIDAIIAAGLSRVVIANKDPDHRVFGRGIAALEAAGVEVETGLLAAEAEVADPAYFFHRRCGRPRVTLKMAATIDGQVAAADGSSQWITSEQARRDAHGLRAESDAVVIGSGSLIGDDPLLTARVTSGTAHQPRPVVIAGRHQLLSEARLWSRNPLVIASTPMEIPGAEVHVVTGDGGRPRLDEALALLGDMGSLEILVEGGPNLAGAMWRAGLVDRFIVYLASKVGGGIGIPMLSGSFATVGDATEMRLVEVRPVGRDLRIEFVREEQCLPE